MQKLPFGTQNIRVFEADDERWIPAIDVCKALGYKNPSVAAYDLAKRNAAQIEGCTKSMLVPTTSGNQTITMLNLNGVVVFCMKSDRPEAIPFQKWAAEVLEREIRKMERPAEYKALRLRSKETRSFFTDVLKDHGIEKPHEFIQLTYQMKTALGIDRKKPKDELELVELCQVIAAEALSVAKMHIKNPHGYPEVKPVCVDSSKSVASAMLPGGAA